MNRPPVLVTRPLAQAIEWVAALQAHGVAAEPLPLIEIAPAPYEQALAQAWRSVAQQTALMFVSANAVQHFMAARPSEVPLTAQAWGTGPGTAAALRQAGWPETLIRCPAADAPTLDSEALWALLQAEGHHWPGTRVLIVRGADASGRMAGRDWLAQQLVQGGVHLSQCAAYVRRAPHLDAAQRARARTALQDGSWWLMSSSEAAAHLHQLLPDTIGAASCALATHPRIARRLREQGWGRVLEVPATLEGQVASIECLE